MVVGQGSGNIRYLSVGSTTLIYLKQYDVFNQRAKTNIDWMLNVILESIIQFFFIKETEFFFRIVQRILRKTSKTKSKIYSLPFMLHFVRKIVWRFKNRDSVFWM